MLTSTLLLLAWLPAAPLPRLPERIAAAPAVVVARATVEQIAAPAEDLTETSLTDLMRFPNRETAATNVTFLNHHLTWLEGVVEIHPILAGDLQPWIEEIKGNREQWEWLWEAQLGDSTEAWRLERVRFLRDRLVESAWYAGRMAPVAPLVRFQEIR